MDGTLLGFVVFSLLLTITPGADTALVTRAALAGGRPAGFGAVLGVSSGLLFHATLSALSLSVILSRSAALYEGVKLAGAAYLLYLGVRAWLDARHTAQTPVGEARPLGFLAAFAQGLTTNVLNPSRRPRRDASAASRVVTAVVVGAQAASRPGPRTAASRTPALRLIPPA